MAKEKVPDARNRRPDPPSRVSISISVAPSKRARRVRQLGAALVRTPRALFVMAAVAAATLGAAALLERSQTNAVTRPAGAREHAPTRAVAAAYGYPHRCLSIVISAANPDYASARVNREGACASYRGYVNASFHRVHGVWRLILRRGTIGSPGSATLGPW